jgi:hypothetical protein
MQAVHAYVVWRFEKIDSDLRKFLRLFIFWGLRLCFFVIDAWAAWTFPECAEGCSFTRTPNMTAAEDPRETCQGLILSIATFNLFTCMSFIFFLLVRQTSDDRDRTEAALVTRVLILVSFLLKVADIGMAISVYTTCFPDSASPPYDNFMSMRHCEGGLAKPRCQFADFFALYGIYCILKVLVSTADTVITTPQMWQKSHDWYVARKI